MPWIKVDGCPNFQGVNWIHPLFQKRIARLVEHTKENNQGVENIIVFGSVVSNRCHPGSDIDIVVTGNGFRSFSLPPEDDTPYDILFTKFGPLDKELVCQIEKEGVVVYGPFST